MNVGASSSTFCDKISSYVQPLWNKASQVLNPKNWSLAVRVGVAAGLVIALIGTGVTLYYVPSTHAFFATTLPHFFKHLTFRKGLLYFGIPGLLFLTTTGIIVAYIFWVPKKVQTETESESKEETKEGEIDTGAEKSIDSSNKTEDKDGGETSLVRSKGSSERSETVEGKKAPQSKTKRTKFREAPLPSVVPVQSDATAGQMSRDVEDRDTVVTIEPTSPKNETLQTETNASPSIQVQEDKTAANPNSAQSEKGQSAVDTESATGEQEEAEDPVENLNGSVEVEKGKTEENPAAEDEVPIDDPTEIIEGDGGDEGSTNLLESSGEDTKKEEKEKERQKEPQVVNEEPKPKPAESSRLWGFVNSINPWGKTTEQKTDGKSSPRPEEHVKSPLEQGDPHHQG